MYIYPLIRPRKVLHIYVTLCVGGSKDQNLSSLGYCNRNFNSLIVGLVIFTCGIDFFILQYHSKSLNSLICCYNHHFKYL